jgi:hypothetical protein
MGTARVQSPVREILALSEPERQELAREVLPALLTTPAGLAESDFTRNLVLESMDQVRE